MTEPKILRYRLLYCIRCGTTRWTVGERLPPRHGCFGGGHDWWEHRIFEAEYAGSGLNPTELPVE